MLEDGLSYPFRGDWVGRLIIGGALSFLSVLVVPVIFVTGYLYRVIAQTVTAGDDTPPEFNQWGELAVRGVGVTVIAVVYRRSRPSASGLDPEGEGRKPR